MFGVAVCVMNQIIPAFAKTANPVRLIIKGLLPSIWKLLKSLGILHGQALCQNQSRYSVTVFCLYQKLQACYSATFFWLRQKNANI
jgi:hypothetical protein